MWIRNPLSTKNAGVEEYNWFGKIILEIGMPITSHGK
jgi:hypothetical protein